jgi:uncharacterized protein YdeI (YjbR/CyaY-like superfamily)
VPERSDKDEGGQRAPPAGTTAKNLPVLAFATARAWSEWLEAHHASSRGLRLKIENKGAGAPSVTYAEALIAAGTMKIPDFAELERAKGDGRWERAYDAARSSNVPADLVAAFARNARARKFFDALDGANRYAILYRVQTAKKPETRVDRITRFVALCARHERIHPRRQTKTAPRSARASKKARPKE